MPPPRYFAGRAPAPAADSSSEEDAPATSKLAPSAGPVKRPRFVARVVSQPDPETPSAPDSRKPRTASTFVSVKASTNRSPEEYVSQSDDGDGSSSYDSGSGSSSDSDRPGHGQHEEEDDEEEERVMPRPVFIAKNRRMKHEPDDDEKARIAEEQAVAEKAARRREAQGLVAHILAEEENRDDAWGMDDDLPDDEDREEDREAEYALWKVRELLRIKRDRDQEAEWKQKRSGEAVEPRKEDPQEPGVGSSDGKEKEETEKRKPAFLQKHYKMGPFFLETEEDGRYKEDIYNRDFNAGTREDTIQKQALLAPLQVRRGDLGRAGRSKYTHLAAEDTAAGLARELRQDKELAAVLPQDNRGRKT